ncbi:hypothetical protein U7230_08840 [Carboxydochorda subterranea]|uniref:HepT-like domain-containing protein n=1 Tax=Carboxydichorda subterranea TaxID=3109565 RepID=A0ABZ1BU83_9FIRM|nr:hypothetical protein [Limnochorda sp. L945t]WRP16208.1 hypothetical protein U7230_08840 [Limnochorda sp. L945t]
MSAEGGARARRLLSLLAAVDEDIGAAAGSVQELALLLSLPDESVRAAAAATHLLRFYGAIEQALERIAQEFDGGAPSGREWHRELLRMMARTVPEVRPAVLSAESLEWLDGYRKFRHRVLRAYGSPLVWGKMAHLVQQASEGFQRLRADIDRFSEFVRNLINTPNRGE